MVDVVKSLSEQLQQVQRQAQLQLVEQQATITEQQAFIEAQHLEQADLTRALTERANRQQEVNAEQARLINALNVNVFRLERPWRASECLKKDGNLLMYKHRYIGYVNFI